MENEPWDGVERRVQDRALWAALDLYDSQMEHLKNREGLIEEEVYVINERCRSCMAKKKPRIDWYGLLRWIALLSFLGLVTLDILLWPKWLE